jgi:mycothiol synthase
VELDRRPLTRGDAAALSALLTAAEAADRTGELYSEADIAEELDGADADLPHRSLGLFTADGPAGYLHLYSPGTDVRPRPVHLDGVVHPAHRGHGLGAELLGWALRRAPELWPGPLTLRARLADGNDRHERLLAAHGFTEVRRFFDMECALPHPGPVTVPAGLRLTGYAPEWSEPLRLARNTAFADHWGSIPRDAANWREEATGSRTFRPALTSLLLDDAGAIAAYALCAVLNDADPLWVANIGTLPAWRGRGAASALLAHTLNEAPAHGHRTVALSVDTGNATGALTVYQRAGFTVVRETRMLARDLP